MLAAPLCYSSAAARSAVVVKRFARGGWGAAQLAMGCIMVGEGHGVAGDGRAVGKGAGD